MAHLALSSQSARNGRCFSSICIKTIATIGSPFYKKKESAKCVNYAMSFFYVTFAIRPFALSPLTMGSIIRMAVRVSSLSTSNAVFENASLVILSGSLYILSHSRDRNESQTVVARTQLESEFGPIRQIIALKFAHIRKKQ